MKTLSPRDASAITTEHKYETRLLRLKKDKPDESKYKRFTHSNRTFHDCQGLKRTNIDNRPSVQVPTLLWPRINRSGVPVEIRVSGKDARRTPSYRKAPIHGRFNSRATNTYLLEMLFGRVARLDTSHSTRCVSSHNSNEYVGEVASIEQQLRQHFEFSSLIVASLR
jgi:hypothetical protein